MTTEHARPADPARPRSLALTAALVGIVAGLVAASFAYVVGEPRIDEAIAIEGAAVAALPDGMDDGHGHDHGEASVSRSDQRSVGLFGAYALTGAAFGAILALTAHGLRRAHPDAVRRIVASGVVLAGAFTVAPWLKYPPNPPAVGDPATITERQWLYIATIVVTLAVGLLATILHGRLLSAGWALHRRLPAVAVAVVAPMLVAFAVLPPPPDAVEVPATLVWDFRLASLGANLLLWAGLTIGLAYVVGTRLASAPQADAPVAAPSLG
jgi:predicted cobalt transporter CbtA